MTATVLPLGSGDLKPTITDARPPALDGGGQPGRARRQAGQAGDRADQRAVLRHDPHRQDHRRARTDHGPVEQVPPRGPARPGGALLVQRLRRQARAAVDPRAGQGPRRSAGHRRRQPDPQARRGAPPRPPAPVRAAQELARRRAAAAWPTTAARFSADFLDTVDELPRPGDRGDADRRRRGRVDEDGHDSIEEAKLVVERGVERARALGRKVEWRVARGEAGPEIVRAADRRQVRRHLHEPARRLSPRRHHRLRLQYPLRPRARPLPRHPGLRPQVDPHTSRPTGQGRGHDERVPCPHAGRWASSHPVR